MRQPTIDLMRHVFDTLYLVFVFQEMYQKFIDGEDVSKIPKEQDPFWEDIEDVLIGTANLFLQSLAFSLDFDDKLTVTDYKVRNIYVDNNEMAQENFLAPYEIHYEKPNEKPKKSLRKPHEKPMKIQWKPNENPMKHLQRQEKL